MDIIKTLIKTDRNGTKYWKVKDICPRCGGRGDYIRGINYGTCFLCGGNGRKEYVWKEYTPEHEAKLEAARAKRNAKRLAEKAAYEAEHKDEIEQKEREWISNNWQFAGFNADGIGYIHYGDTYKAKDALKREGAKWCGSLQAWIAPKRIECKGVKIMQVAAADLCEHSGTVDWDKAYDFREKLN